MPSPRTFLAAFASAALAILAWQRPAAAAEVAMLRLVDAPSLQTPATLASSPVVAPVRLNLAALEDVDGRWLTLPLPDGKVLRVERTDVERRGRRDYAWRGRTFNERGEVNGFVTLTVLKDRVLGRIMTPGKAYRIAHESGRHWLAEAVEPGKPCGATQKSEVAPLVMQAAARAEAAAQAEAAGSETLQGSAEAAAAFTSLRLVVVYPKASARNNPAKLIQEVQAAVDDGNTALANSGINARIVLVGTREVSYTENRDPVEDLNFLYFDPAMIALRRQLQAPLISMITLRSPNICGIAYLLERAEYEGRAIPTGVSVLVRDCLHTQVLVHELGHNLGAQHDPANITYPESLLEPYSKAHFVPFTFRTVMSYSSECGGDASCPIADFFSTPNRTFNGEPVGIANERDNARLVEATHGRFATRPAAGTACRPGADRLCLLKKRFQVEVHWDNQFNGTSGNGRSLARTDAAGFFSFGDPSNLELMVKLLDFGDVVKVFWGQLTNLKYQLTVTDLRTGQARTYQNTPGDCGGIDQGAFPGGAGSLLAPLSTPNRAVAGCKASSQALCLDDRFTVSVDWRNPGNGTSGQGVAVPFSKLTGAFHFGEASNIELMAKVINQGDRIDFFWGALSDLEYTIRVTDTATGQVKTYQNAAGRYCGGLEVDAF